MSDLQPVPPVTGGILARTTANKWVDANAIIQQVLQNLEVSDRKSIVLRCDDLPCLHGTAEEVEKIFSGVLQMILQKKVAVSSLLLHISCKVSNRDSELLPGRKLFYIRFCTNITPCTDWIQRIEKEMAQVVSICNKNGGHFEVAQTTSQGCIFSVSLPGKFL
jgi:hypothetical protein